MFRLFDRSIPSPWSSSLSSNLSTLVIVWLPFCAREIEGHLQRYRVEVSIRCSEETFLSLGACELLPVVSILFQRIKFILRADIGIRCFTHLAETACYLIFGSSCGTCGAMAQLGIYKGHLLTMVLMSPSSTKQSEQCVSLVWSCVYQFARYVHVQSICVTQGGVFPRTVVCTFHCQIWIFLLDLLDAAQKLIRRFNP